MTQRTTPLQRWRRLGPGARILVAFVGAVVATLAVVSVVVTAFAVFPALRGRVLENALARATSSLPGEVRWERAEWRPLDRVRLDGLLWTQDGDTLAAADRLELAVDFRDLSDRDLRLTDLEADELFADLPGLRAAFPTPDAGSASTSGGAAPVPFLRGGSLPGLPSAAVDRLAVGWRELRLDGGRRVSDGRLVASADLRRGHEPFVRADSLTARVEPDGWTLNGGAIAYDPRGKTLRAELAARRDDGTAVTVALDPDGTGNSSLRVTAGPDPSAPAWDLAGGLSWSPAAPLRIACDLHGTAPGGRTLDLLHLDAAADSGLAGPIVADARCVAVGWDVAVRARVQTGDSLVARISPVDVAPDGGAGSRRRSPGDLSGRVVVRPGADGAPPAVRASDLRLTGAFGDVRLEVRYDGRGVAGRLRGSWPTPPQALEHLARAAAADTGAAARAVRRLDRLWPAGERVAVDLDVDVGRARGPTRALDRGTVRGRIRLPGPRSFQPLLPPGVRVDDLGLIDADVSARVSPGDAGPRVAFRVDLARTAWLRRGLLSGAAAAGTVTIDSLALAMPGVAARASGRFEGRALAADLRVSVPDTTFLARLPLTRPLPDVNVDCDAHVAGPRDSLRATVHLTGAVARDRITVPRADVSATVAVDTLVLAASFPEGIDADGTRLDTATLDLGSGDPLRPLAGFDCRLHASGKDVELATGFRAALAPAPRCEVDSLVLRLQRSDLRAARPFRIARDADGAWRVRGLELAGALGRVSADGIVAADSLALTANADLSVPVAALRPWLPSSPLLAGDGLTLDVRADAGLGGSGAAPIARLEAGASLRGSESAATLGLQATAGVKPGTGLTAKLRLTQGDTLLASADARLPLEISLTPWSLSRAPNDSLHVGIATRTLSLADFSRFVPSAYGLEGALRLTGSVDGIGDEARLAGELVAPRLKARTGDGSWADAKGELHWDGTLARPRLRGDIDLQAGVIQLPDVPPQLLATGGDALLWSEWKSPEGAILRGAAPGTSPGASARPSPAATDTTPSASGAEAAHPPPTGPPAVVKALDLQVKVSTPGNFWLRGHGLEVELAGDLSVAWKDALPAVVGRLEAVQGTFKFLGRVFTIDRGLIVFQGDPESDPELDLTLTTLLDGVTYTVKLSGTAAAPRLDLSSDPAMEQGDILSTLLFGQPLSELDSGQQNLLRERAAQIAAAFGAARLQQQLAGALGVDLIAYQQSGSQDRGDSLMIGKYLNPRVLLKYEQIIDRGNAFFVTLDYTWSRAILLSTTLGQGQGAESGGEIKWKRDY